MGQIPALEDCKPGLAPVEFNVIVAPEVVEDRTKGGLYLPETKKEIDQMAATRGRLVAISPLAFTYETWPEGARIPQVGDIVWYAKYGGTLVTNDDGQEFRILKDKDIAAIVL